MSSPEGVPSHLRCEAGWDGAAASQKMTTRPPRPSRSAAGKANARISAAALHEASPEVQDGETLLTETLTSGKSKREDSLAWVEMESEPVRHMIPWCRDGARSLLTNVVVTTGIF